MRTDNIDPEDASARLTQEATNQSSPDKSLTDRKAKSAKRFKIAPRRNKAPVAD